MQRRFPSEGGTAVCERKELSPRALGQAWEADLVGQAAMFLRDANSAGSESPAQPLFTSPHSNSYTIKICSLLL